MNSTPDSFLPPSGWRDPRTEPGFVASLYPHCDGSEAPPIGTQDPTEMRKLEFLAAYYAINLAYARLKAANENERSAKLLDLNTALNARDGLEDRYSPIGFFGEPRVSGTRTLDVTFMYAPAHPPQSPVLCSSAFAITPPVSISSQPTIRILDADGLRRFLEELIIPDGKTRS